MFNKWICCHTQLACDVGALGPALVADELAGNERRESVQDLGDATGHVLVAVGQRGGQVIRHRVVRTRKRNVQQRQISEDGLGEPHPVRKEARAITDRRRAGAEN